MKSISVINFTFNEKCDYNILFDNKIASLLLEASKGASTGKPRHYIPSDLYNKVEIIFKIGIKELMMNRKFSIYKHAIAGYVFEKDKKTFITYSFDNKDNINFDQATLMDLHQEQCAMKEDFKPVSLYKKDFSEKYPIHSLCSKIIDENLYCKLLVFGLYSFCNKFIKIIKDLSTKSL